MSHLGERLSAFVDGELGHGDRDRVLNHLARCETCRFEAEMLRTIKRRLNALGPPQPAADFLNRLSALSGSGWPGSPDDPPSGGSGGFGSTPPLGASRPIGGRPVRAEPRSAESAPKAGNRLPRLRPGWGRARYAVAGASVLAAALGAAFVAGEEPSGAPVVTPALADYAIEHAVVSGQAPLPGPVVVPMVSPESPQDRPAGAVERVNGGPGGPGAADSR